MQQLLKTEQYYKSVRWECDRTKDNDDYVTGKFSLCNDYTFFYFFVLCPTDVYDCQAWKDLFGPVKYRDGKVLLTRMGLLVCMDGFPAFHQKRKGAISLMPAELINLNLPPHARYDPDNMMVWLIIPNDMSSADQLKYFEYVSRKELNPLATEGVPGPDGVVKIKLFGASLDLKGKEKFYHQTIVTSYCGCSTCTVHYDQGPGGPIFATARRYLAPAHPLRQKNCTFKGHTLEFYNEETRTAPAVKTSQILFKYDALRRRHGVQHFLGQKGPIMLHKYLTMEYAKFNLLEWMHGMKCVFDNTLDFLIGKEGTFDTRARTSSKLLGVFKSVWPGKTKYLSQVCMLCRV